MTTQFNTDSTTVYDCSFFENTSNANYRAHVRFTEWGDVQILSRVIHEDTLSTYCELSPGDTLDTQQYTLARVVRTDIPVCVHDDLKALLESFGISAQVGERNGKYHVFSAVDPPKGAKTFAGTFETPSGKKTIYRYSLCKQYSIVDDTTGAAVDVEPGDIGAYFEQ